MGMLSTVLFSRKRDEKDLIDAYVWSHLAADYDPIQAGTSGRVVIEKYCSDAQKEAAKEAISEWKKKWESDPKE